MKDAFKDAEATPSENVWTNIELDLEKAEGGDIRRRLFYYKLVAAASVIFALSVGVASVYVLNKSSRFESQQSLSKNSQTDIATENQTNKVDAPSVMNGSNSIQGVDNKNSKEALGSELNSNVNHNEAQREQAELNDKGEIENHSVQSSKSIATNQKSLTGNHFNSFAAATLPKGNDQVANQKMDRIIDDSQMYSQSDLIQTASVPGFPRKQKPANVKFDGSDVKPDAGALLLAQLAEKEMALQAEDKKKEVRSERLWTSVGFAAGAFSSTNSSVSPTASLYAQNNTTASQQTKASGSTYSAGINLGAKIAKRWVLQGGLNYLTQTSDYTANSAFISPDFQSFKVASSSLLNDAMSGRVVQTADYQVNNTLQFVSVPLQAGYILVNKKVVVQLNSGVSTDLFLQNTLTPQNSSLEKTTQESGSDSPYRTVNFSGLVGTEISYKFGEHYRLALNPGVRYPFNSIYKSDVGLSSSPLTFDVGLRFRYIFH
ncbi:MAG: outer membrane beta-barrel protein [Chryseolinea sp.]